MSFSGHVYNRGLHCRLRIPPVYETSGTAAGNSCRCFPFGCKKFPYANSYGNFKSISILKFEVINTDSVAVLDAHGLPALKHAGLTQDTVKVHAAFVVIKID